MIDGSPMTFLHPKMALRKPKWCPKRYEETAVFPRRRSKLKAGPTEMDSSTPWKYEILHEHLTYCLQLLCGLPFTNNSQTLVRARTVNRNPRSLIIDETAYATVPGPTSADTAHPPPLSCTPGARNPRCIREKTGESDGTRGGADVTQTRGSTVPLAEFSFGIALAWSCQKWQFAAYRDREILARRPCERLLMMKFRLSTLVSYRRPDLSRLKMMISFVQIECTRFHGLLRTTLPAGFYRTSRRRVMFICYLLRNRATRFIWF